MPGVVLPFSWQGPGTEARPWPVCKQRSWWFQVDVHIMMQPPSGEWLYLDTLVTNSSGRVSYTIPETHRLGVGVYPIKMVVRYVPLVGQAEQGQPRMWEGRAGSGPWLVLTSYP